MTEELRVHVGDLLHRVGTVRDLRRSVVVDRLESGATAVPADEPVDLDLRLEPVAGGIVVLGAVSGRWAGPCSRCLEPVEGPFSADVHELFEEHPVESETYPLEGEEIDLEPLVRDLVVLDLPLVPLCDDACAGLCPSCGVDRNVRQCTCADEVRDPRWRALDEIRFEDS